MHNISSEQETRNQESLNKQQSSQEKASNLALLNERYQNILTQLETLSTPQLSMSLREVKWLLKQLGTIMPNEEAPNKEICKQASQLVTQVDTLQEALTLEIVRRQFFHLQVSILDSTKKSIAMAIQAMTELSGMSDATDESQENDDSTDSAAE